MSMNKTETMKLSQQLRIGNLIYRGDEVITVTHLTISSIVDLEYLNLQDIFKPIAITTEWLDRLVITCHEASGTKLPLWTNLN